MYRVLRYFEDLADGRQPYNAGDEFPREGLEVSDERLAELSTGANRRGVPLIAWKPDAPSLDALSKAELVELAKANGVDFTPNATKADIKAMLERIL